MIRTTFGKRTNDYYLKLDRALAILAFTEEALNLFEA
jgi:hypothetical protein